MELKVHCDCGQKYKFDVEPVNNQMPFTVACPICKRDGTPKANAMLQQMALFKPVETVPAATSMAPPPAPARLSISSAPASAAPAPVPIAPLAPPPPPPSGAPKLRINAAAHAEPAAAPAGAPPAIAPALGATPPPIGARPRLGMAPAAAPVEPGKEPSFGMGLLGGFVGALIGSVIYYFIFKTTGVRIFLALGTGALAGFGANWLGRGEGSKELGGITAVFVVVGVLAAQYLVILGLWNSVISVAEDAGYSERLTQAKEVVKAVPTGADSEIRMYLAKQAAEDGEAVKPASVSDDEIKEFKEKELPEDQDFASGKITKDQYMTQAGMDPEKTKKFMSEEGNTFKAFFILYTLNLRAIISMVVGAGLAFKLSTNARGG
jgi:hypothetical protein